jgi:hypothetical protein
MHSTALGQPLLVPEGTRLLHIGPPKTATTTVQGALGAARDDAPDLRPGPDVGRWSAW